jgi:threonine dehydratase
VIGIGTVFVKNKERKYFILPVMLQDNSLTITDVQAAQKRLFVLTYSSGNHAQAMPAAGFAYALAGKLLNIPTTIVMPDDAPAVKQAATRDYGAEVILYDRHNTNHEELAQSLASDRGLKIVVEPTGVLAAAALLESVVTVPVARIGIIISGGNVDLTQLGVPVT